MRLFVGIELSADLASAAASVSARLQNQVQRVAPTSVVRWVPDSNLHITLWFLGEVADARLDAVLAALREPLRVPAFTMRVAGAGAFPPSGPPRAAWLGVSTGREELVAVYQQLAPRLTGLGFEREKRPYSPHLTIARVKDCRPAEEKSIRRALESMHDTVGECEIRFATLFRSRTSPAGSRYEVLLRTPLTAD